MHIRNELIKKLKVNRYTNNEVISKHYSKVLRMIKPDIVHIHHLMGFTIDLINITQEFSIPVIITLHDYWYICPTTQMLNSSNQVCSGPYPDKCKKCWCLKKSSNNKILEALLKVINTKDEFYLRNEKFISALKNADRLIAPSKFLKTVYAQNGIPKNKIIVSYNGYKSNLIHSINGRITKPIKFGFVGRINYMKGVHILIDAFRKIKKSDGILKIYGVLNNTPYVTSVKKASYGKENIYLMGSYSDINKCYNSIDILVFPSIWYENCPLVISESKLARVPLIASRLGAISEFVDDGINGLLFEAGNVFDLYEKMNMVIKNPELIRMFSNNITQPESIEDQIDKIMEIYDDSITKY